MQTTLTEEQQLIQSSALDWLVAHYDLRQRAASLHRDGGDPGVWRSWASLGWLGLPLPFEHGGLSADVMSTGLLAQALGRHLTVEPWLACVAGAGRLLALAGDEAQREAWLGPLIDGELRLALAHREPAMADGCAAPQAALTEIGGRWRLDGRKCAVAAAPGARRWIVSAHPVGQPEAVWLCLVDPAAPGICIDAYDTPDGGRAADIGFDGVVVEPGDLLGGGRHQGAALRRALAESQLAALWYATGAIQAALDLTVSHVTTRRQFGKALSEFQSVQQRLAEMHVQCAEAQAACELAAMRLARSGQAGEMGDAGDPEAVAMAGSKVLRAVREVAQAAVQLHGAMGVCEELPIAPGFRTLLALALDLGGAAAMSLRFGDSLLASGCFATSATLHGRNVYEAKPA